eukprot:CAMPEP_0175541656 /NCGR_PEP_ID=MMETSP0096-20121207/27368_1 /TAXON_ID=311494 /ORGANISM="Alexandrium monilatum, Strain CCMP3105" /LENGTH=48 /DNA_ID= /DNA_START= /DNA_END= /DNA_ORIENTATION=
MAASVARSELIGGGAERRGLSCLRCHQSSTAALRPLQDQQGRHAGEDR